MRISILMQFDAAYRYIGHLAAGRALQYANLHGYPLFVYDEIQDPSRGPSWAKVQTARRILDAMLSCKTCDYLFWLDADTLIMDINRPLEPILSGKTMDVSQDYNGLCAGVFGIQVTQEGLNLLSAWNFLGQVADETEFGNPGLEDQATLMLLDRKFPKVHDMIGRIPESIVANQDSHASAPFIYHYWARGKNKIEVFTSMMRDAENTAP
jgi:hypothetical protein